jgi:SAM-dependent methyltransferase
MTDETSDRVLAETAPLALSLAARLCCEDCREYHAVWGFLRLYGVLPSVSRDADFVRREAVRAARDGAGKVFISGSADHGLLALLHAGFAEAGRVPHVVVADLCPTPLALNAWYAGREGLLVETYAGDILSFQGGPFDLIAAHNFLNFFTADDRARLVGRWAELLRPGGRVVTVNGVKPHAPEGSQRFGDEGAARLKEKLRRARCGHFHATLIEEAQLAALVDGYARKRRPQRVRSVDELSRLFTEAGLELETFAPAGTDVPWAHSDHGSLRMQIVARKPL